MDITTVLIFLLTFLVCAYIANLFGILSRRNLPPGPWGVPILGHLHLFGQYPPETFEKWRRKHGHVFRLKLGSWNSVVLNGYDVIKGATDNAKDAFSYRPPFLTQSIFLEENGAHSLAFGPFDEGYLHSRKVISSALRSLTDKRHSFDFQGLVLSDADTLVQNLLKRSQEKEPLSVVADLQVAVGSSVYQLLYGRGQSIREGDNLKKMLKINDGFVKFAKNGNAIDVMPWLAHVFPKDVQTFRELNKVGNDIRVANITEHEQQFDIECQRSVTDMLLAADTHASQVEETSSTSKARLLAAITDLSEAGLETTTTLLKWLILYMAAYPDTQQRVQQEISDTIGNERHIDIKERKRLLYTDAVIHEVLRKTCVLPFALPHFAGKDDTVSGYDIPTGTVVIFNLHSIAYEKDFWGDPEIFRPERFICADELDHRLTARVLPFGLGRRRCIGDFVAKMQLFLLFVTLMQKCTFVKQEGEELDLRPVPGLVYGPKPYKVLVEERM